MQSNIKNYEIKNIKHKNIKNIIGYKIKINLNKKIQNKPTYRFLTSFEQCVEKYDKDFYYIVIKISKDEKIGFKHKKYEFLEELTNELFDDKNLYYILEIFFNTIN